MRRHVRRLSTCGDRRVMFVDISSAPAGTRAVGAQVARARWHGREAGQHTWACEQRVCESKSDGALTLNQNVDNTRRSGGLNRVRTDLRTEPFGGDWWFTSGGARRSRRRLEVRALDVLLVVGFEGPESWPFEKDLNRIEAQRP